MGSRKISQRGFYSNVARVHVEVLKLVARTEALAMVYVIVNTLGGKVNQRYHIGQDEEIKGECGHMCEHAGIGDEENKSVVLYHCSYIGRSP